MLIFELLDQQEGICRRAFFGCAAKLNKTFKTNIIEILLLIMCIPRKINFLQLRRYGRRGEQRYRQTSRKIDFANPDKSRMNQSGLVIHFLPNGSHRLCFSTDTAVSGKDVYDIYRTRFQIEFCFRDGHQFTGLFECQTLDEKALDFAYNVAC